MQNLPHFTYLIHAFIGLNTCIIAVIGYSYFRLLIRGTKGGPLPIRYFIFNLCGLLAYTAITVLITSMTLTLIGMKLDYFAIPVNAITFSAVISSALSLYLIKCVANLVQRYEESSEPTIL